MNLFLQQRVERLRQRLASEELTSLVVIGAADCRYLTDFTGEASSVLVSENEVVLFTDARFTVQAEEQSPAVRAVIAAGGRDEQLPEVLWEILGHSEVGRREVVGIDSTYLTVRRWEHLRAILDERGVVWRMVEGIVESCREVKFADEVQAIREAGRLATSVFAYLENTSVIGKTEKQVALDIEVFLRSNGSEGLAFPSIVACGERASMPHAEPSGSVIEEGQVVVFDIGAVIRGYASDITRTYSTGDIDPQLSQAYQAVLEAQQLAVAGARAGVTCKNLDEIARRRLEADDLEDYFVHSLGHGVGLEVHEGPTVSQRSESVLEPGMVITIEPGVYLPGIGGIRIEDTVVIGDKDAEVLTPWPRGLRRLH